MVDGSQASDSLVKALVAVNAATLVSIITFGVRVVRFFQSIEFKTDLMWTDYNSRMDALRAGPSFQHRRSTDE